MGLKARESFSMSVVIPVLLAMWFVDFSLPKHDEVLDSSGECHKGKLQANGMITLNSTICGSVLMNQANNFVIILIAPEDKYKTHYFSLELSRLAIYYSWVQFLVSESDEWNNWKRDHFRVDGLTFKHDTIGSYRVTVRISAWAADPVGLTLSYILKGSAALQETDTRECPTNTSDYVKFGGSCYVFYETASKPKTWTEANVFCEQKGGILLAINNEQEYSFIKRMLQQEGASRFRDWIIYLGLIPSEEGYRWSDGTPGIFTDWYRPRILEATDISCNTRMYITCMIQPINDPSCTCTAMVKLTNHYIPTEWTGVPCLFPHPHERTTIICEFNQKPLLGKGHENDSSDKMSGPVTETFLQYNGNFTRLIRGSKRCPQGWSFNTKRCFKLLSSTGRIDESISCTDARILCTQENGYMAATAVDVHLKLLHIWLHKPDYGSIWLGNCTILAFDIREAAWVLKTVLDNSSVPAINVMCESAPVKTGNECAPNQFRCKDGTCILGIHRCDLRLDCFEGEDEWDCACKDDDFRCEDGRCIPYSKYCNFRQDCLDNSDEKNCTFTKCPRGYSRCTNGQCVKTDAFGDYVNDCMDSSDEGKDIWLNGTCNSFQCYSGKCIPDAFVKNMRVDCTGQRQEDERLWLTDFKRGRWLTPSVGTKTENMDPYCTSGNGTQTRCRFDHVHCFERHLACVYDVDKYGFMSSCPHGEHLRVCSSFECPDMFKCPESYCIPFHKVCDGKRDCADGEDETSCSKLSCPGLFRCRTEGLCLDQSFVCDGIVHCKQSFDDELVCPLKNCPQGCTCSGWSVSCTGITNETITDIPYQVRSLRLTKNTHSPLNMVFENYVYLGKLHVIDMGIQKLESSLFDSLRNLLLLDLRDNQIMYLAKGIFYGLKNLQHLYLSGNSIKSLGERAFDGLSSIRYLRLENLAIESIVDETFLGLYDVKQLSLKNNSISHVSSRTWKGLSNLQVLDLRENQFKDLDSDAFSGLDLDKLHTDHFKFCCLADHVKVCTPEGDAFSSCNDLMANGVLQVAIWILGMAATVGNVLVIIVRAVTSGKQAVSVLIINLSVSDLLMGVYLLIIGAADTYYRGRYILYADSWRSSAGCKTAGFLSTLSSEMSVFTLTVITADRLVALVFPFSKRRLSLKSSLLIILCGWIFFVPLSVLPILNLSYFGNLYIKNGVCLLFNIAEGRTQGWEYSLSVVTVFNLIAFLFILFSYICIYCKTNESRKEVNRDLSEADIELAERFLLIVITDFICWMPIILVTLLSLGGFPVSPSVTAWIVVFILPVNSALNPFLYTFSSLKQIKRRKKRKLAHKPAVQKRHRQACSSYPHA